MIASRLDPELDRAYDARSSVPDYAVYPALYRRRSEEAFAAVPHRRGVPYGDDPAETLDVFPAREPGAPVLVYVHGGYWRALSAADSAFVVPGPHAAGATVVTLDHTLAPAADLPRIVDQCRRALAWVGREISAFHGDPRRVVVAGSSAGGHLAAVLALTPTPGPPPPVGLLALSGIFDLAPLRHTRVDEWMGFDDAQVAELSPGRLLDVPPRLPRAALLHGADEPAGFADQTRTFAAAWRARRGDGVSGLVEGVVPDRNHFDVVTDLGDLTGPVGAAALDLLGLSATPEENP